MTDPTSSPAVPPRAAARLAASTGKPGSLFTSDLTVNEFALIKECGFSPLALVMGTAMYHLGIEVQRWTKSEELDALTHAMTCLLYTSPSPRDRTRSRMPSSA